MIQGRLCFYEFLLNNAGNIKDMHGGHKKKRLVCKAYMPRQDVCYFVRDVASFCQANFQVSLKLIQYSF